MKKSLLVLALLAFLTAGAFAQGYFGLGGGALLDMSFNNTVASQTFAPYEGVMNIGPGAFAFFDFRYLEFDISVGPGFLRTYDRDFNPIFPIVDDIWQLGISILFKYPNDFKRENIDISLFPLFGANYNLVLPLEFRDSQFGLLAGGGIDWFLPRGHFLRLEAMFHLRFPSPDAADEAGRARINSSLGMGPRIKFAWGYDLIWR